MDFEDRYYSLMSRLLTLVEEEMCRHGVETKIDRILEESETEDEKAIMYHKKRKTNRPR